MLPVKLVSFHAKIIYSTIIYFKLLSMFSQSLPPVVMGSDNKNGGTVSTWKRDVQLGIIFSKFYLSIGITALVKSASCTTRFFSSQDNLFHNILFQIDVDVFIVFDTSGNALAKRAIKFVSMKTRIVTESPPEKEMHNIF